MVPKKFKFKGVDKDGDPIIMDNEGNRIKETKEYPDLDREKLVFEVFKINPT